jgi:DNA-binding transcriptional ArsR family regulator
METIVLHSKKELDIYVNPQRQKLLRLMTLAGRPMTPKQLSVEMGVSPSSVQHHLNRLMELNLVALDHAQRIRGITAHYYTAPPRTVSIGCLNAEDNGPQRMALIQNGVNGVFSGFVRYLERVQKPAEVRPPYGDALWGVTHLMPEEAAELLQTIQRFIQEHEPAQSESEPWEYALIAYPVAEDNHA